ncbi:MAG TPA: hypothetical protein VLK79_01050 [Gaiellales bacterium]|nr:hypothetical protein [Gaiellales bacterium]
MRTTSRLFRTVLVAAGLLAISASAAQAMPSQAYKALNRSGIGNSGRLVVANDAHDPLGAAMAVQHHLRGMSHSTGGPVVVHSSGFVLGHQLSFAAPQPMASAADSPTNQTPPTVIAQPVSVQSADNGFDWTDAAIGALVASVVLILAAVAATIVRPRQTVQL